jgi:integrase
MPKITRQLLSNLKPDPTAQLWVWDSTLPGFGVRLQPTGRATYVMRYRTQSGTQRKHTIGRCTDLHPDEAREIARGLFSDVAKGGDPAAHRQALRAAPTVANLAHRHLTEHASRFKPRTARNYEILWRLHILPRLGNRKVVEVTTADVVALQQAMAKRPTNANRAREVLSKAMDLAELWGWREVNTNPCAPVRDFAESVRERILTPTEIAQLAAALAVAEADEPALVGLVRALMFTGCRVNEIASAQRAWLNADAGKLYLPDSKTGAKVVEMPQPAIEALQGISSHSKWLVPNKRGTGHLTGFWRRWARLRKAAGLEGLRLHDLRHTVGSMAHRNGATQRQVADLLGHKQISTAARYIHGFSEDRQIVAAAAAAAIQAEMQKAPG